MKRHLGLLCAGFVAFQAAAQVNEYKLSRLSVDYDQRQYVLDDEDRQPIEGKCRIIYPGNEGEKEECEFRNGKRNGVYLYFLEHILREKGEFRDGLEEGVFYYYDSDGKTLKREVSYKAGKPDGVEKIYCSDGKLRSETGYVNGLKDGVDRSYDCKTGKITLEQHYKGGELHGQSLSYVFSSDGEDAIERTVYEKGRQNGEYSFILLDGTVREAGYFTNGRRSGEWIERDVENSKTGIKRVYEGEMIVEQEDIDDFNQYVREHRPELEGLKW
ncbi:MAG: hypothetical protein LIP00_08405 [Parabacteroides sp.]|nr:hypothetical protein [Parabacteroides sp.]